MNHGLVSGQLFCRITLKTPDHTGEDPIRAAKRLK
ncbi:MAG: hypothetical protein SBU_000071 [Candidatus Syntrophoarchaeum butanivorans]|uniref:Uncharacterized protein n=1 Tax=Candidatus Syntropharchaeum butanivorans TaxID=1839936 RepID=A0A1F2P6E3_9EURY|nr:MAG: hypothetical protein SBU_000071 [Candidatus Syntrophoarchaeum butanivorans]